MDNIQYTYVNILDSAKTTLKICEKNQNIGEIVLKPHEPSGRLEAIELPGGTIFLNIRNSKNDLLKIQKDGVRVERKNSNQGEKTILRLNNRVRFFYL